MNKQIAVYDNTVSARTYLSYIAEQAGGFACIGRDGKLYIRTIGEEIAELPLKYFQTFKWGDKFGVSRVRYEDGIQLFENGNETENTIYISQDNMYIIDQQQIDNIYNQLTGLEVYSFEGDSIIDPALDVGDILIIDSKKVIYQGSIQYGGKFKASISSKIQSKSKEETMTRTPSQKTINRRIQSQIDQVNGEITQLITETTEIQEQVNNIIDTTGEAEGNIIHIEDSAEEPLVDISLYGKASGKNKFNYQKASDVNNTIISTYRLFEIFDLKPNTQYTISSYDITSATTAYIYLWSGNTMDTAAPRYWFSGPDGYNTKTSITFTSNAEGKIYLAMYQSTEDIWNEFIQRFKYAQIEEGTVATDYVPYNSIEIKVTNGLEKTEENYQEQIVTFPLDEGQTLSEGEYLSNDGVHTTEEIVSYTEEQQKAWDSIESLMTYKNITDITSDAYAKVTYMRDNGLDIYETKQNADTNYTETNTKLAEQKITVDGIVSEVSDITSKTNSLTEELEVINAQISEVNQSIEGLGIKVQNKGGNNLFYYDTEFWNSEDTVNLEESTDTEIKGNSISGMGYIVHNGSAYQSVEVQNGTYTVSFKYKKTGTELANTSIKINGEEYPLAETDWTEFVKIIDVTTNHITVEFISDTDNTLYVVDLLGNVGTEKDVWTQNPNETRTDTVTIGKGIKVESSKAKTFTKIDADGTRVFNVNNLEDPVAEFTEKGIEVEDLEVKGQAQISGTLIQQIGNQTWISSLL